MKLLLDTCSLVWFLRDDPELSSAAAEAIENPANEIFVSVVSFWELAIKASLGKILAPVGLEGPLENQLQEAGFQILNLRYSHVVGVLPLPFIHRDPFDRLMISQCRAEGLTAVTPDPDWSDPAYDIKLLW